MGSGQVLYLVRHCQATGQEPDAPLTEIGQVQAIELADRLGELPVESIISSPFARAVQSITPWAKRLGLNVARDERLVERVLSTAPLANWRERLAKTFVDLDLSFAGGESSRTAMMRGIAVINQASQQATGPVIIVTHGNLLALILKYFDETIGYAEWESLLNPDVFCLQFRSEGVCIARVGQVRLSGL